MPGYCEKLRRLDMGIGFVIHENADHQHTYICESQLRDILKQKSHTTTQKHSMIVINNLSNTRNLITFLEGPIGILVYLNMLLVHLVCVYSLLESPISTS